MWSKVVALQGGRGGGAGGFVPLIHGVSSLM